MIDPARRAVIEPVAVDDLDPDPLLVRLRRALAGGAPLAPYAEGGQLPTLPAQPCPADDLAVVVSTSGSTGRPKLAMLTASALRHGAEATEAALDGPGRWILALPAQHIAGLQVLVRSIIAGTDPVVVDRRTGFRPGPFAAAVAAALRRQPGRRTEARASGDGRDAADESGGSGLPLYVSLVPTQVARLLDDPAGAVALARCTAVLVGGAALPQRLRERAGAAGVRLVATYGMSETAGGCVYDGRPLRGTTIRIDGDGRILLGGPTIALGYLGDPERSALAFVEDENGGRWFATDDLGEVDADGRLHVLGRRDDVIVTGGLKVHPRVVEDAVLARFPQVRQAVAVGVSDPVWGQLVSVAVTGEPATAELTLSQLRAGLRGALPAYALPRRVAHLTQLPERGPGKPDRAALVRMHARFGGGEEGESGQPGE